MMKKTIFFMLVATSFALNGAEDRDQEQKDRDDRSLFESNRARQRRNKSDRYRSHNYRNYWQAQNQQPQQTRH